MPNANVQFQGVTLPIPGAYYADNVSAALPANPALVPPLVLIGNAYGMKPMTPYQFTGGAGLQSLLAAVRGGPVADFIQFISNPSPVLFGAAQVTFINAASGNTQSALTLNNASGTALITLTSADYGPPSNLLQAEVDAGTQGGVRLTLFDGYTGTNSAQADNLGVPFQLAYTGAASGATFHVTAASGTGATSLTLTSLASGESVSYPLGTSQYATVGQLVAAINSGSYPWAAQVIANQSNGVQPTSTLDAVSGGLPVPNAGIPVYSTVSAGTGGILFWVNQFASGLATASLVTAASGNVAALPAPIALTHFSGAVAVAPTTGNYASALNVAATVPAWVVFCDSNDPAVVALGVQHAQDMSAPNIGKPRRFISGSSIGDTPTQAQTVARDMAIYQGTYVYPGIYRTDLNTGANTLYSGLHAAAAVASMMAGNQIAQPLTQQALFGNGVERALSVGAGGDIDLLQQAGVMPVYASPDTGLPTIVSDFTTWQFDNNPENIFNQQVGCRQALAYSLSQGLRPLVGSIASPFGLNAMKKRALMILKQLIYSPGNNGILASFDPKSLVLTYSGDTQAVNLTVNVVFVGQVRFILELVFVQPLNLAA